MLVKHIRSRCLVLQVISVAVFPLYVQDKGEWGWRKCSLHHDWVCVTRLHQLFTIRHVLWNKGTVQTGREDWGLTQFTDLVLKQYFTNDLLNLNVRHLKRRWSISRELDLLEPQSFGREGENISLNANIIDQVQ